MFNEKNDFEEIVDSQQTLFRNLSRNHRFYFIFALSSIPFWVSFIILVLLLMNNPHDVLSGFNFVAPVILCCGYILMALLNNFISLFQNFLSKKINQNVFMRSVILL
ncbi:MAG: hypothetical protein ACTSVO_05475 [Candidatus Heimdallarchaeaceae archaeon]